MGVHVGGCTSSGQGWDRVTAERLGHILDSGGVRTQAVSCRSEHSRVISW